MIASSGTLQRRDRVLNVKRDYFLKFGKMMAETIKIHGNMRSYLHSEVPVDGDDSVSEIEVTYVKNSVGRWCTSSPEFGGMSLQMLHKKIRNSLIPDYSQDIDIVNSEPTILEQILRKEGCNTINLKDFVDNYQARKEELFAAGISPDEISIIKGFMMCSRVSRPQLPMWFSLVQQELDHCRIIMKEKYPELWKQAVRKNSEDNIQFDSEPERRKRNSEGIRRVSYTDNRVGIFMSYVYFKFEGEVLLVMDEAGRNLKLWNDNVALMHDGILVFSRARITEEHLTRLEDIISEKTNLRVILKIKPRGDVPVLDITKFPGDILIGANESHKQAAEYVKLALQGKLECDYRGQYVLVDGVWRSKKDDVKHFFTKTAMDLDIKKERVDKEGEVMEGMEKPFTSHGPDLFNTVRCLQSMATEYTYEDFSREVILGSVKKIAYLDGYVQFTETRGDDGKFWHFVRGGLFKTFVRINKPFPINRSEKYIQEVKEKIYKPMFEGGPDGLALMDLVMTINARCMAGCPDKLSYLFLGDRNSGKSVIAQFVQNTFGPYVGLLNSSEFIVGANKNADANRQNACVLTLESLRICRMSEIKMTDDRGRKTTVDGAGIKAQQSGFEGISSRKHQEEGRAFFHCCTLQFSANDFPPVSPTDTYQSIITITMPNVFIPEADKIAENNLSGGIDRDTRRKIQNPEVQLKWIRDEDYIAANTHIILDAYRPDRITPLPSMLEMMDDMTGGQGDDVYETCLEVTLDENDVERFDHIQLALEKMKVADGQARMALNIMRIIKNAFKHAKKEVPTEKKKQIKFVGTTRTDGTRNKTMYRYVKIRQQQEKEVIGFGIQSNAASGDGAYAPGFYPGCGN